jgi:hypothetical protein
VRLIGGNHNLIGQILKGFEDEGTKREQQEKKGYSVKRIADKQKYNKSTERRGMVR